MTYEPTTEINKEQLTKKQHFHMRAILKRFDGPDGIRIQHKANGVVEYVDPDHEYFLGMRAWSQETEQDISWPIEEAFLREIKRLEAGNALVKHEAVSQYHLLWTLRHSYALSPCEDQAVFPDIGSTLPKDVEEWLEARCKVPIRKGGMIAGRFITTAHLKQDFIHPENLKSYEGIVWNVIRSTERPLISADNYGSCLLMVVSPNLALQGGKALKP